MTRLAVPSLFLAAGLALGAAAAEPANGTLALPLRTRVEAFKGSGLWDEVVVRKELPARETAIIICDMWDKHWCDSATRR